MTKGKKSKWKPEMRPGGSEPPQTRPLGPRHLGKRRRAPDSAGAPWLTPGTLLSVVTELYALGLRVEDVGTTTLLDHVLLEAGVNAHLEERREARGFRSGLTPPSSLLHIMALSTTPTYFPPSLRPADGGSPRNGCAGLCVPAACTWKGRGS